MVAAGARDPAEDQRWMRLAIGLASHAAARGEVPVGAVLVHESAICGEGWNGPIGSCDPTAHAEIVAIRDAAGRRNNYRLLQSTLYVTLEPCVMCVGAMVHARIERVVFGAPDPKSGAVGGSIDLSAAPGFNHRIQFDGGVLALRCGELLREFFRDRR